MTEDIKNSRLNWEQVLNLTRLNERVLVFMQLEHGFPLTARFDENGKAYWDKDSINDWLKKVCVMDLGRAINT